MATPSREEIFEKVQTALVEALSVDQDEVTESATLQGDLGAESIDILDIAFRLEKAFGIKIGQDEMAPQEILQNPDYVTNNRLNPAGLAALKGHVKDAEWAKFEQDPDVNKVMEVFTVASIVSFIESKLAAGN